MPAELICNDELPDLAARVTPTPMLRVLRQLRNTHFIQNNTTLDTDTKDALASLAKLGLVDPGYSQSSREEPFIWLINGNGERVLENIENTYAPKLMILPAARMALQSLSAAEREGIIAAIESLMARPPKTWTADEATQLEGKLYIVRATSDLRGFVNVFEDGSAELADIAREETIRKFLERSRTGSKAG